MLFRSGEEFGIFFAPKARFAITDDLLSSLIEVDKKKMSDILVSTQPHLKVRPSFDTYIINWREGRESFEKILSEYQTILPDIYMKIINSKDRLDALKTD